MPRGLRARALSLTLAGLAAGCGKGDARAPTPGPACVALHDASLAAVACDPALEGLAATVQAEPNEAACIAAVRTMLSPGPSQPAQVRSVYEPEPSVSLEPLSENELAALARLRRPATLVISPDVGRVPGIPPTAAVVDGLPLTTGVDGRLSTDIAAGRHTVRLRHAGRDTTWCLELSPCETLEVVAHGAHLAPRPGVSEGACP